MVPRLRTIAKHVYVCVLVLLVIQAGERASAEYSRGGAFGSSIQVQESARSNGVGETGDNAGWVVVVDVLGTIAIAVFSGLLWFVTRKAAEAARIGAETAKAEYVLARRSDVYLGWLPLAQREDGQFVVTFNVKASVLTKVSRVSVTHAFSRVGGGASFTGEPPATGWASPHRSVAVHWSISPPQDPAALAVDVEVFFIDAAGGAEDSVTFRRCYTRVEERTYRAGERFDEGEREEFGTY